MIPVVAAFSTFLLLAGAGIAWAVRRDSTRRGSGGWIAGSGVDHGALGLAWDVADGGSGDCDGGD